jgi:hypothetical protein
VKAKLAPFALLAFIGAAPAVETTQWPPPAAEEARMRALQQEIVKRDSTPEQRDAARKELARLLMSPAARSSPSPLGEGRGEGKRPARAAIDPYPSVPAPAPAPRVPMPGVAELEVVSPPKPIVDPRTGAATSPAPGFAIDPRTGAVLHETPWGYVDPRTGRFVPK